MVNCFGEEQITALFPLFFACDNRLCLIKASARLQGLVPAAQPGAKFEDLFELVRPKVKPQFSFFCENAGSAIVINVPSAKFKLRGQVVLLSPNSKMDHEEAKIFFAVSAYVTVLEEVVEANLALTDFAAHDSRLDLVLMAVSKNLAIEDAKKMAAQLRVLHNKEKQRAEALAGEFVQRERLATLGQLVAGVAHEVNTPLGVALTAGSLAEEAILEIEKALFAGNLRRADFSRLLAESLEAFAMLQQNLRRAADLIRQFKGVAIDQTSGQLRQIEIGSYIKNLLSTLKPLTKEHGNPAVEIVLVNQESLFLTTNPGALAQIITNLIQNAIVHAFPPWEPGRVEVSIQLDKAHVAIEVNDNGVGMPPDVLERIFDPFFTTRSEGGGSGLGLFVSYNLANDVLYGKLEAESLANVGTKFRLTLPIEYPKTIE